MPGDSGVTCMLVCALPLPLHTRPRAHRPLGIPCALNSERAGIKEYLAQKIACGEIAKPRLYVIASAAKQSSSPSKGRMDCFAALAMTMLSEIAKSGVGVLQQTRCKNESANLPHHPPPPTLPTASREEGSRGAVARAGCLKIESVRFVARERVMHKSSSRCRRKPKSPLKQRALVNLSLFGSFWSGRRGSNPRPRPWQGRALPLSYTRIRCRRRTRADSGRAMPNAAPECNSKPRGAGTSRIPDISGDPQGKSGQKPAGRGSADCKLGVQAPIRA